MEHMDLAVEVWRPLQPVKFNGTEPPQELKDLIEKYGFNNTRMDELVDTIRNHPTWSFTEIQSGCDWAEHLMEVEIAKVDAKVKHQNEIERTGFTDEQCKEIKNQCRIKMREYTKSPTGMVGADLGPLTNALAKRVQGILEVKGTADTATGV